MSIAQVKRFRERWNADGTFREAIARDPDATLGRYGIRVDPEAIRPLWDAALAHLIENAEERHRQYPLLKDFDEYLVSLTRIDLLKNVESSTNQNYAAWRRRQVARTASQFPKIHQDKLIHAGMAIELTQGCSVGCWFCGLAAAPLQGTFPRTPENAALWRGLLEAMGEILGPAAASGFCYWGTEPFDNPDYEAFCEDFFDILGVYPQTTTARALSDPQRTRSLIRRSLEKGCTHNRFSIPSLAMLNRVHEEFSAEELEHVLLMVYTKESERGFAVSGRAATQRNLPSRKGFKFSSDVTIACVSGFLISMVERSVSLITPCKISADWPFGYMVYERAPFQDARSFRNEVERMVRAHMPIGYPPGLTVRYRPDLEFEEFEDGFAVSTKYMTRRYDGHPYLRELGNLIRKGTKTTEEIASVLEFYMAPPELVQEAIDLAFQDGILDEAPPTPRKAGD